MSELVKEFMTDYTAKIDEVGLTEANEYVDAVLLPKHTEGMNEEALAAFVQDVQVPVHELLMCHSNDAEKAVEELTEDA